MDVILILDSMKNTLSYWILILILFWYLKINMMKILVAAMILLL